MRMEMKKRINGVLRRNAAVLLSAALVWTNLSMTGQAEVLNTVEMPGRLAKESTASGSDPDKQSGTASGSNLASSSEPVWTEELVNDLATFSNMNMLLVRNPAGDLWEHWTATDFKFLDGRHGKGTQRQPYQIQTKAHLMALSQLASLGMVIADGVLESDAYVGNYEGDYFELVSNINLGGMDWIPIGFYQNQAELTGTVPHPFRGNFNGNGYTVSNYRISHPDWNNAGLFGAVEDSSIWDLNVTIGDTLTAGDRVGILAGYAGGQVGIRDCSVKGNVRGRGVAGGLVGFAAGDDWATSVIEDCQADVTVDCAGSDDGRQICVGGIAGQTDHITVVDCDVETANNSTARIQGKGWVGGITGWQNDADLYHVRVLSGTIGGNGAQAVGGITGHYTSGDIKAAQMAASIGSSGLGNYAHEGVFIGDKGSGCSFTYGTNAQDDMAYMFTDTEARLNAGVCGSDVPDDNQYSFDAHIGFWHSGDQYFTLKQGNRTKTVTDRYFYEELEKGVLNIMDEEINGADVPYTIDHVAPDSTGRPGRGYLLSIPQIDTAANGIYFYDVAQLSASGNGAYYRPLDKERRGAIAAGTVVTVVTSPNNTDTEKYQMEKAPFYQKDGAEKTASYVVGGQYTFLMPANDTELTAIYRRVAANVDVSPREYNFRVVQTRTGSRKSPTLTTVVTGNEGNEIARYVNGALDGTQIRPVVVQKTVDANNDVADSRVLWSVDDPDLIRLLPNGDQDAQGYTDQSASIQLKPDSRFFHDIIEKAERTQADSGYRYAIPATIYGAGHAGGGIAVLTAATRKLESFEGKPCVAQCRIKVTFQMEDQTYVDLEEAGMDHPILDFVVTRTLSGSRKAPVEKISVTPPQTLTAVFQPEYFSRKDVSWEIKDSLSAGMIPDTQSYQTASIFAVSDAQWIRDIVAADTAAMAADPRKKAEGSGTRETVVTVKAEDKNGNQHVAQGTVRVRFETVDQTGYGGGGGSGSGGSGGSGGGSGGGGGSSSGITPAGTVKSAGAPSGAVTGIWVQDAAGHWLFTGNDRTYAGEWAYIHNPYAAAGQENADWFCFDNQGYLISGWYTDTDQNVYYLNPVSDGTLGRMVTGWNWIDGKCYYFNLQQDGTRGKLLKNAVTPDACQVNADGAWILDGRVQTK